MNNIHGIMSTLGFALIVIGIVFFIFGRKSNEYQQSISIGYIGGGIALILVTYFFENPDFLELATAKVAIAALGGIIIFIKLLGRFR